MPEIVPGTIRGCNLSISKRLWLVESQWGVEDVGRHDAGGAAGELGAGEGRQLGVGAEVEERIVAGLAAEAVESPGGNAGITQIGDLNGTGIGKMGVSASLP